MNIFVIPSWYPDQNQPIFGVFCKEQVLALSRHRPDWNIVVSCWGQASYRLPLAQLTKWPYILWKYFNENRNTHVHLEKNLVEMHSSLLHWSYQLVSPKRFLAQLYKSNRELLQKAISLNGSIDIIHAHVIWPGGIIAQQLSREFNIPYVITEHSGPFPLPFYCEKNGRLKTNFLAAYQEAKQVLSVSPYQQIQLQKQGVDSLIVPNSVDELIFVPKKSLKRDKKCTFFTVALTLSKEKGIAELLQAIKLIQNENPAALNNVQFRIGGLCESAFKKMAIKLGIQDHLLWLGEINREDVIKEFQDCDCFILPSHQETLGMVFIEAMFCGKPVIATKCGGPEYSVSPSQGILIDIKHPRQLKEATLTFLKDKEAFDSVLIREKAVEMFSTSKVVDLLESVYRS